MSWPKNRRWRAAAAGCIGRSSSRARDGPEDESSGAGKEKREEKTPSLVSPPRAPPHRTLKAESLVGVLKANSLSNLRHS